MTVRKKEIEKMKELKNKGFSYREIAEETNRSLRTITKYLKDYKKEKGKEIDRQPDSEPVKESIEPFKDPRETPKRDFSTTPRSKGNGSPKREYGDTTYTAQRYTQELEKILDQFGVNSKWKNIISDRSLKVEYIDANWLYRSLNEGDSGISNQRRIKMLVEAHDDIISQIKLSSEQGQRKENFPTNIKGSQFPQQQNRADGGNQLMYLLIENLMEQQTNTQTHNPQIDNLKEEISQLKVELKEKELQTEMQKMENSFENKMNQLESKMEEGQDIKAQTLKVIDDKMNRAMDMRQKALLGTKSMDERPVREEAEGIDTDGIPEEYIME